MRRDRMLGSVATASIAIVCCAMPASPANAQDAVSSSTRLTTTPKTISGHQHARLLSQVTPLTSSSDTSEVGARWSVYSRTDRTADLRIYGGNALDPVGDLVAVAANAGHTAHTFGTRTPDMDTFSSSGKVVTASTGDPRRFYWWAHPFNTTLTLAQQHSTTLPDGYRYLTSAPDGWVEVDSAGQLYDVNAKSGDAAALGSPFPPSSGFLDRDLSAVSGPSGVVVTYDFNKIAYVSFATGHVTMLDHRFVGDQPACWSVSHRAAACGDLVRDDDGDPVTNDLFLAPLDGSRAFDVVYLHPALNDDNPIAVGATFKNALAWLSTSEHDELNIKTPDRVRTTSAGVGSDPVAGPGGFLVSVHRYSRTAIAAYNQKLESRRVVAPRASSAEALAFSLSGANIAWAEDDGAPRGKALRVHRRSISTTDNGALELSDTATVADAAQRSATAVSSKYTVYGVGSPPKVWGYGHQLRVVSHDSTLTIKHVYTRAGLTLSGHRLLYTQSDGDFAVADLKGGETSTYRGLAASLDGPNLVLAEQASDSDPRTSNIRLIDLETGDEQDVADGVMLYPVQPSVFVHGSFVGWVDYASGAFGTRSQYRDMSTEGPVVTLPDDQQLWALTDAGVLTQTQSGEVSAFVSHVNEVVGPSVAFLLQPYDSSEAQTVLTGHYLKVGPQIAGGVVAWIDARGNLKARRLR